MPPNGAPTVILPGGGHIATPHIVAIVLASVAAVGLASFVVIWYVTRRKPDIMLDEDFVDHSSEDNDMVMIPTPSEDPRVFVPNEAESEVIKEPEPDGLLTETSGGNPYMDEEDTPYNREGSL